MHKRYLKLIIKEQTYAPESGTTKGLLGDIDGRLQNIHTYEDLNKVIQSAIQSKKWDALKKVGIDIASQNIMSAYDLFKHLGKLPDDKKTGTFLDKLNVDDDFSKIVDDSIENAFINALAKAFSTKTGELPNDFNINKELQTYIKNNYNNRTVATMGENKGTNAKMNKFSSFKEQQLIAESFRSFLAEETEEQSEFHGAHLDDGTLVCEACLQEVIELSDGVLLEAKYQGRTVQLNKPTKGDVKKFKVYVKDPKTGNVKKVNFGDPNMKIKKNIPARRKSFRARHHCENPGPKTKARYWSCKKW